MQEQESLSARYIEGDVDLDTLRTHLAALEALRLIIQSRHASARELVSRVVPQSVGAREADTHSFAVPLEIPERFRNAERSGLETPRNFFMPMT